MNPIPENSIWQFLLLLREYIELNPELTSGLFARYQNDTFQIDTFSESSMHNGQSGIILTQFHLTDTYPLTTAFRFNDQLEFNLEYDQFLGPENCMMLNLYLPVCFMAVLARKMKRTASVIHLAQSLDGRIATISGQSKWISNDEDLKHAHRMRSLCDAVLIGSKTLRTDKPHLNVRHVQGPNPVKVVIGNDPVDFSSLKEHDARILYLSTAQKNGYSGIEHVWLPSHDREIPPPDILRELYQHNIFSIYIEGGSITVSRFLQTHSVDLVQLYLAPRIFGSGINDFSLPEIDTVEHSISFHRSSFLPMGDGILFSGTLQP